jgi:hypothetical protein
MKLTSVLGSIAAVLIMALPAAAQGPMAPPPAEQSDHGMGDGVGPTQWSGPRGPGGMHGPQGGMEQHRGGMMHRGRMGRPLISMMLHHRDELGLSAPQVESLERLRADFMRDAIRRQADQKIARLDLFGLLRPDPADPARAVDMTKVEGKIREIEKMRADLQVARIRTIEAGKAQLTPDQRTKLAALLAQHRGRWQRGGPEQPAPPRS